MEKVGPYDAVDRLGRGEYSEVFQCRHRETDTCAAVKVFRVRRRREKRAVRQGNTSYEADLRKAFLFEVNLTARFDHPNIVTVSETGGLDGKAPWFAMPLQPSNLAHSLWGRSIPKPLTKPVKSPRVRHLLGQILGALQVIHGEGVVHRDLKPQNVLLDENDNAVLCDFGHALTAELGTFLDKDRYGTMPFTAPEQRESAEEVTKAADIYSVGVLGALLLAGKHLGPTPDPLIETYDTDSKLVKWVNAAMSVDPNNRPTSFV